MAVDNEISLLSPVGSSNAEGATGDAAQGTETDRRCALDVCMLAVTNRRVLLAVVQLETKERDNMESHRTNVLPRLVVLVAPPLILLLVAAVLMVTDAAE